MLTEPESLQTWHWTLPDPVSREVEIIATDAPDIPPGEDRAA